MLSKKVSKFLPNPDVCSYRFYNFEGEELVKACSLNRHVTELVGIRFLYKLNKTDAILSSEAEDLEAAVQSIIEATSWTDRWTFAMKSMAFKSSSEARLVM